MELCQCRLGSTSRHICVHTWCHGNQLVPDLLLCSWVHAQQGMSCGQYQNHIRNEGGMLHAKSGPTRQYSSTKSTVESVQDTVKEEKGQ